MISAGERYDVVLNATQEISNYWIRLHGLMDCNVDEVFQAAILQYDGAPDDEPDDILTYENTRRQGKVAYGILFGFISYPHWMMAEWIINYTFNIKLCKL